MKIGTLKTTLIFAITAIAFHTACAEPFETDGDTEKVNTPSIEEATAISEDYSEPVAPVKLVDILGNQEAQSLFEGEVAHFESSTTFRQVSSMMEAGDASKLQYRAGGQDRDWTEWQPVEITFQEGQLYNILIRLDEPATELELRGGESIETARLEFYAEIIARDEFVRPDSELDSVDRQTGDDEEVRTIRSAIAPPSLVTPRTDWGAISPGKICGSVVDPYRMAIHHTAVPSSDGGDAAARMRSMQDYHMNTLGWCDIGYHFVVAQSGEIFQGRSRSNRPGAHVGGHNAGNVGISFIANFNSQQPTDTQLNSGADILRWVHDTHGVPLTRTAVKGHREHSGQGTTCPGDNMIPLISELLDRAERGGVVAPPEPGDCSGTEHDDADGLFADFPTSAVGYDEAVMLYNGGITNGCSNNPLMFCPNCPTIRSHMAAFLARAAGLDTSNPPSEPTFSDVPSDHTFFAVIEAIADAGITQGCGNDKFCPDRVTTRAQAATMIKRALDWSTTAPGGGPTFDDVPSDHTHYVGIEHFADKCVTNGCGGDNFCPDDDLPRAHAAAFIARAFNLEDSNPCIEAEPEPEPDPEPEPSDDDADNDGDDGDEENGESESGDDSGESSEDNGTNDGAESQNMTATNGCSTPANPMPLTPLVALALLATAAILFGHRRRVARRELATPQRSSRR